jgi:hypothetical protein
MIDYQIAVMSYQRPEQLVELTLATLNRHDTDHRRVTVFVADDSEREIYRSHLPDTINIKVTALGHFNSIRAAHLSYAKDTPLLILDDDINAIEQKQDDKLVTFDGSIDDLATYGFDICDTHKTKMWGIYPVRNAFYMKDQTVIGLRYLVGCLWGTYAQDTAVMTPNRLFDSSGNDFETTLQSFRHHGRIARLDWLTVHTKYFAGGGIDAELKTRGIEHRQDDHTRALKRIAYRHPQYATIYTKSGDVTNLRLKSITHCRLPR